ncbi:MAG: hypothetical protein M3463_17820 [Verrucomicrobiota bacterium]|nr:hypothetical protein [Verrucomicrobiota bacterium]
MSRYSDFVDRLFLREGLLEKLVPGEPLDHELVLRVRAADDATLAGGLMIGQPQVFTLVRGGLFYAIDALEECHALFQKTPDDLAAYWHGMMHRREGDFENARYWFRRTGTLPVFSELHARAAEHSPLMARQTSWDPFLFTAQCEQARFGDSELVPELQALQRVEFETLFGYCWKQSRLL